MSRFQALTNPMLDEDLELLRERLGLAPSQKAELLREVAALAAWIVRQAEQGRAIEARKGRHVEQLAHPAIDRLQGRTPRHVGERLALNDAQLARLAAVLDRGFRPTPALRKILARLAGSTRRAPKLRWNRSAA